jgi:hypothetical protein
MPEKSRTYPKKSRICPKNIGYTQKIGEMLEKSRRYLNILGAISLT